MRGIPRPLVRVNQLVIFVFCMIAFVSGIYHFLLLPFAVGVVALATRKNPVFKLVMPFLKKPLQEYAQEDPDQQRFNQWIAVVCLGLSWLFFLLKINVLGFVFGGMVAAASLVAICGFCIGCFIRFQYLQWRYRRTQIKKG